MGAPSGGGGYGGGGYNPAMGGSSNYGNTAFTNNPPSGGYLGDTGNFGGGFYGNTPQQPTYGMGTGGQYSPQLRQAQTAWQQQAGYGGQQSPMMGMSGGNMAWNNPQDPSSGYNADAQARRIAQGLPAQEPGYTGGQQQPLQDIVANPWRNQMSTDAQAQWAANPRQPYGMGAQGMGNAYGYGGQQGNPFGTAGSFMSGAFNPNPAPLTAQQQANTDAYWRQASQQPSQYNTGQQGNPFASMLAMLQQPQQQGSTSLAPPVSQPQAPLQAPRPAAPPPPAAPTRANYSPNNPFAGMYTTPQGDAWEQQQRGGAPAPVAPTPAAPGTDVMRKALAAGVPNQGTNPGYGYGTPGGYQLDTAPSTLDPGSMNALLGIMGGNINGVGYPTSAANYANWYQQTYGTQAPGGPRAYPF